VTVLYFDCFSGASGDMLLGALIDAGVPLAEIRRALGSLAIDPDAVWTETVVRTGIRATKFCVRGEHGEHTHAGRPSTGSRAAPDAGGDRGAHRRLGAQRRGQGAREGALPRLGEVEAAIHGVPLDQVHLHEVGALDSIIDIVGTVHALEYLDADRIVASPLNVGSGSVRAAHGVYPVPAPATLQLLAGAPVYAGPQKAEMVTPTGALLVGGYAAAFGPLPPMTVRAVGYGAGSRDFPDAPNVLRVVVGDTASVDTAIGAQPNPDAAPDRVSVIEAEIDDMTPQLFGVVMDALLAAGALDVFYTSVQMKKNRPGTLLTGDRPAGAARVAHRAHLSGNDDDRRALPRVRTGGARPRNRGRRHRRRADPREGGAPAGRGAERVARVRRLRPRGQAAGRPVKDVQALAVRAFHDRLQGAPA
jgi:uncharacterized protein (TIGR00299 family) protein